MPRSGPLNIRICRNRRVVDGWEHETVMNVLPQTIAEMVAGWPEFRMGVKRVGVVLSGGQSFDNVVIAGSEVVKVWGFDDIPFDTGAIVAATDQAEDPLPKGY